MSNAQPWPSVATPVISGWSGTPPAEGNASGFQSGFDARRNPGGKRNGAAFSKLARNFSVEALNTLVFWMRQRDHPAHSLRATEILIERMYGKAPQKVEIDGEGLAGLEISVSFIDPTGVVKTQLPQTLFASPIMKTINAEEGSYHDEDARNEDAENQF